MSSQKFDINLLSNLSYTPRLPIPGETIVGSRFSLGFGGKGANQAVMATRLGARTAVIGKIGGDYFGHSAVHNLKENGVSCGTLVVHVMTGVSNVIVTETGQNSIITVLGANLHLSVQDIHKARNLFKNTSVVLCQLEHKPEVVLEALKIAKESGVTIFNPAPAPKELSKELLLYSDIVCPNEFEAKAITGISTESIDGVESALQKFLEFGTKTAVITLGEKGCAFATQDNKNVSYITAQRVKAVDTTGAGDAFLGSLAFFTAKYDNLSMEERLRRSCALASLSVERPGTMTSYLHRHELPQHFFG
ncbi:ribokinase [Trichuris trichiura]|uniref:Ribokinase n=1 Tax=Trichuris trichiura TaxID=36087 RepID=A0A077ZI00_TRITR|nr:ribokinase [Trichuris trichiura]